MKRRVTRSRLVVLLFLGAVGGCGARSALSSFTSAEENRADAGVTLDGGAPVRDAGAPKSDAGAPPRPKEPRPPNGCGPLTRTRPASALAFASMAFYAMPTAGFSVTAGDFNGDCYPDLILPFADSDAPFVLINAKNGTFTPMGGVSRNWVYPMDVAVGDFNGDGNLDAVTFGWVLSDSGVILYVDLGHGDGTFEPRAQYMVAQGLGQVVVADVDRDGALDLVLSGGARPGVLRGNGDGTFTPLTGPLGSDLSGVAAADLNHDGLLDLVMGREIFPSAVDIFYGNADASFQPPSVVASGFNSAWLATGDFDEDGNPDIVFTNDGMDTFGADGGTLTLLFGASFTSRFDLYAGISPRGVAVADFDGDGHLDVVNGSGPGGGVRFSLGNGDGTLKDGVAFAPGGYSEYNRIAVADFNRDGRPDVAIAAQPFMGNQPTTYVGVLLNVSH